MPKIFHDQNQRNAHKLFQQWREKHPNAFFINRRSEKDGLLHRSGCPHPGATTWTSGDVGASLTAKMKVCGASVLELTQWAKVNGVRLGKCENCRPKDEKETTSPSRTFLVTWNPKKFPWHNLDEQFDQARRRGFLDEGWTCNSTHVKEGDRVFLLRQGMEPKGIMASGYALSETYEDTHYADPKKRMTYVNVRWDTLLHPERERILSREALNEARFEGMHWDIQSSGIRIPSGVAVELEMAWAAFLSSRGYSPAPAPNEILAAERFWEGAVRQVTVNAYERNPFARKACIEHYGSGCAVCETDFFKIYGALGKDFIHVHHLRPLSGVGKEYEIDPIKDLRPVCPNCHAMIHRREPALSIEGLKRIMARKSRNYAS